MDKREKQFEDFTHKIKFDDNPDIRHRHNLELKLLDAFSKQTPRQTIWRTIMKNNITKLAVATAVILIAALGIVLFEKSATTAWAIEQTIEALRKFNAIHITGIAIGKDGSKASFNLWARAKEDGSASDKFRLDLDNGQIRWVQDNSTYNYDPNRNMVQILTWEEAAISPWIGPNLLQVLQHATKDWAVSYGLDPKTGRNRAFVTCSHPNANAGNPRSWWFEFDTESKLLVSFKQWDNLYREGLPAFDAQKITYYENLPDETFDFKIPEGAIVVQESKLDDPNTGMSAEDMTQEEAGVKIVREYWQAVIDENWDLVSKLRPIAHPDYSTMRNPFVEIVNVGQPYQQEGCSIGPVVPVTMKFKNGDTREIKMVTKYRDINGKSSYVIMGTFGKEPEF